MRLGDLNDAIDDFAFTLLPPGISADPLPSDMMEILDANLSREIVDQIRPLLYQAQLVRPPPTVDSFVLLLLRCIVNDLIESTVFSRDHVGVSDVKWNQDLWRVSGAVNTAGESLHM